MPSHSHIERYYAEKRRLIDFGGSDSEQNIRRAFENCLDSYCRDHREGFALVAELPARSGVRPDGTVVDSLRLPRGYWEAKDSRDDLDAEAGAEWVANSMTMETTLLTRSLEKGDAHSVDLEDLVALTIEASAMACMPLVCTNKLFE